MARPRNDQARVLAGTSSQYLRGAVPHLLRDARLVLVLGPRGVGKSSVVRHFLSGPTLVLGGHDLAEAASRAVRRRAWPDEVLEADRLVIDGPTYLERRAGVRRLLTSLLEERTHASRRTVVIEGDDASALLLQDSVPPEQRVTLNLRYPKNPGRRRFVRHECLEIGLDPALATDLSVDEPWTYLKVKRALRRMQREATQG